MSRRENVFSGIHVPVVDSGASAANPFSYSQTRSTFRTAGGNTPAARTSLGSKNSQQPFDKKRQKHKKQQSINCSAAFFVPASHGMPPPARQSHAVGTWVAQTQKNASTGVLGLRGLAPPIQCYFFLAVGIQKPTSAASLPIRLFTASFVTHIFVPSVYSCTRQPLTLHDETKRPSFVPAHALDARIASNSAAIFFATASAAAVTAAAEPFSAVAARSSAACTSCFAE